MIFSVLPAGLAGFVFMAVASAAPSPSSGARPDPAPFEAAPAAAPDFRAGAPVVDRNGASLGPVISVAEGREGGLAVVVKLRGKLIAIPESDVTLMGDTVVSRRTRSELLAPATAPRR